MILNIKSTATAKRRKEEMKEIKKNRKDSDGKEIPKFLVREFGVRPPDRGEVKTDFPTASRSMG